MIRFATLSCLIACTTAEPDRYVTEPFDRPEGEVHHGRVATPRGDLDLSYELVDGRALFQGDIEIDPTPTGPAVATRTDTAFRWTDATVPYVIDTAAYTAQGIAEIEAGIADFNAHSIFHWAKKSSLPSSYTDYVYITNAGGCNSWVGRQSTGKQVLSLGVGCVDRGRILHEMGHAVGLWHEQSRADRDDHVIIHEDNIISQFWIDQYKTYVENGDDGQDLYDFDFGSVMLYPSFADSIAKDKTKPIMTDLIGNTWSSPQVLSANDVSGMTRFQIWPSSGRSFMLQFVHSGKCLDVEAASRSPNKSVNQFACHGGANQRWYAKQLEWSPEGKIYAGLNSGQCLDIINSSTASGAGVRQFPCSSASNERFELIGTADDGYQMKARHSGMCLTVDNASTANGVWVRQRPCTGAANQRLKIVY